MGGHDGQSHYPGTYAHGGYNRETTIMGGRPVHNEDLVNLPNWLVLKLRIEGEEAIRLSNVEVLRYRHVYDIRTATVIRELRFRDRNGRETSLGSRRFVSMAHSHQAATRVGAHARELVGPDRDRLGDRRSASQQVSPATGELEGRHLDPVTPRHARLRRHRAEGPNPAVAHLHRRGRPHPGRSAAAIRSPPMSSRDLYQMEDYIQQVLAFDVTEGEHGPGREDRVVLHLTRRDQRAAGRGRPTVRATPTSPRRSRARRGLGRAVASLRHPPSAEPAAQLLLRLHIAHLLQVCSRHTAALDAGSPPAGSTARPTAARASGTSSTSIPFLNFRLPEVTRGC